jgi:F1F0 ATPase subunit 2
MMFVIAALAGILFGIIYFGGLWLTIQKMSQVNRPILLLTGSFIVRLGLVLVGFYLVSNGRLEFLSRQPDHVLPDPLLLHQQDSTHRKGVLSLMEISPDTWVLWESGLLKLNATILFTWLIMAILVIGSWLVTRKISRALTMSRGRTCSRSSWEA